MSAPLSAPLTNPAHHPFPPLAPAEPAAPHQGFRPRHLPQIALPWLDLGLAALLIVVLWLG